MATFQGKPGAPVKQGEEEFGNDFICQMILVSCPLIGILWTSVQYCYLNSVQMTGPDIDISDGEPDTEQPLIEKKKYAASLETMNHISRLIQRGAQQFLWTEYLYIGIYIFVFSGMILAFYVQTSENFLLGIATTIAFVTGALTSIFCGYFGMHTATIANVRTTHECWAGGLSEGFDYALRAGSVIGVGLVSLGILVFYSLLAVFWQWGFYQGVALTMYEAVAGFGLGASSVALFGRVAGGIYTKAADVGADLAGKNDYGLEEDDVRNPACIADNVGDNVGDIAGMGSDLFGSFAEATCASLLIAANNPETQGATINNISDHFSSMMFPLLISSSGVAVALLTLFLILNCGIFEVNTPDQVEKSLAASILIGTILHSPVIIGLGYFCFQSPVNIGEFNNVGKWAVITPVLLGLWSGLLIGKITEYYTSHSYFPVREISLTQRVSAATGIIYGLALGYLSAMIPIACLAATILISHELVGMYGIALAALGMLGSLSLGLTIDSFGPIADNAGGIAEMSGLDKYVRECTDALDAAGNTTAAVGKGFAIGSAALVGLALFGAFKVRSNITTVDVSDPWTFTGLLCGAAMPYLFSAMLMKSVGLAAEDMVTECLRQFPGIVENNDAPDYEKCIHISTVSSLRETVLPGTLVILGPLIGGLLFGKNFVAGMLSGILVSGIPMAISMSNTGGAWDNSKKYIEKGGVPGHLKGSACHKNAVTGDTVGDPLKDTSGPALNILVKLSAIMSVVFGSVINKYSNPVGGPFWE